MRLSGQHFHGQMPALCSRTGLSGGERKRLNLACELIGGGELVSHKKTTQTHRHMDAVSLSVCLSVRLICMSDIG